MAVVSVVGVRVPIARLYMTNLISSASLGGNGGGGGGGGVVCSLFWYIY